MDRLVNVLAGALGVEPAIARRAVEDLSRDMELRRVAGRALAPYMNRAYWNYQREGHRLAAAIYAARLQ